jgi:hypothetical protein
LLITGFDGRNVAISVSAVELKALMACTMERDHEVASKIMRADGWDYTPIDVKATVDAAWLIVRSLCSQVQNLPDDEAASAKPMVM